MKIYIASDHAGFELKEKLKPWLRELGFEVKDFGAYKYDANDDYPDFIRQAAEAVANDPEKSPSTLSGAGRGVIIGGSGQGEAMAANRVKGVRAVVFYGPKVPMWEADVSGRKSQDPYEILKLSREHNDSNVISLGARFISEEEAKNAVRVWIETSFTGGERHVRRINKIDS